jgi:hypothetical protein
MTLTTETRYTLTCDATVRAACNEAHPEDPHTCHHAIVAPTLHAIIQEALAEHWAVTIPGGDPAHARAYCPTHRDQTQDTTPAWTPPTDPDSDPARPIAY